MNWSKQITQNKRIIESLLSLSILNGLNLFLPLITLPYILRVIGPTKYGVYSFIYVIIQYILLLSNYGFNLSVTKQIAQVREEKDKINLIYNSVLGARLMLTCASILLFMIISLAILKTIEEFEILFFGLGIILGDIFIPVWLFQGMEEMKYLTLVNIASKLVFTFLIFFFITAPEDYKYIILLNSLGYIVAGIFSTLIALIHFKLSFLWPLWKNIKYQLIEGFHVFCSTLSMNLYRNSNVFILGLFTNDAAVGIYSAAEKVIKALQGVVSPVAESFFPYFGYKFKNKAIKENVKSLLTFIKPFFLLLLGVSILVYIFSPFICKVLLGDSFMATVPLIRLMTLVILLGGLNYVLGIVGLINLDKQKYFFRNAVLSGSISILFMVISVHWIGIYAGALSMIISEMILFVTCFRVLYLCFKGI